MKSSRSSKRVPVAAHAQKRRSPSSSSRKTRRPRRVAATSFRFDEIVGANVQLVAREETRCALENDFAEIISACEASPGEFELRAEFGKNPDASKLGVAEKLPTLSDRSLKFLHGDVELLIRAYQNVVDGERVVASLSLLRRTLCSKFHVDHVPLRLMCTYCGKPTEVLKEDTFVSKVIAKASSETTKRDGLLVRVSDVLKTNSASKIFEKMSFVRKAGDACDVCLMAGTKWEGNKGNALVHRSPVLVEGEWRLVLRIDELSHVNEVEAYRLCVNE